MVEGAANAGAFDTLQGTRAQLFNSVETAIEFGQQIQSGSRNKNQLGLFDISGTGEVEGIKEPPLPDIPDWSITEKLKKERELLGFYISGHPLEPYKSIIHLYTTKWEIFVSDNDDDENVPVPSTVRICGQINEIRTLFDRKQQKMAFVKLEDFNRGYEVVIFGSVFPKCEEYLKQDGIVFIQGTLNSKADDNIIKLVAESVFDVNMVPEIFTESVILKIDHQKLSDELLHKLKMTITSSPGKLPLFFNLGLNGEGHLRLKSSQTGIAMTQPTLKQLCSLLGEENVLVKLSDSR